MHSIKKVRSFDVFDTLIARRAINSEELWISLGMELGLPDFANARIAADDGSRDLYEIYAAMVARGHLTQDISAFALSREIELEISQAIPITENLQQVRDGDILVTDTYLTKEIVLQILRAVGFDKQVTIYRSNGDKRSGYAWSLLKSLKLKEHLGDNVTSDFTNPLAVGVEARLDTKSRLTVLESSLRDGGLEWFARLIRELRLRCIADELVQIQATINLPFLLLLSELIHRAIGDHDIVFLGRDCFHLERIYSRFYSQSRYLPFSRAAARDNKALARRHLAAHSSDSTIFFDISSTGATWELLEFENIMVAFYSDTWWYTAQTPVPPKGFSWMFRNSAVGPNNGLIEIFNTAPHGELTSLTEVNQTPVCVMSFGENEYNQEFHERLMGPIECCVNLEQIYGRTVRRELEKLTTPEVARLFLSFRDLLCANHESVSKLIEGHRMRTAK
jgi:hypothetical protein